MRYNWDRSESKWTLPPTQYTYTYDSKAQVLRMILADSAATQPKARRSYGYTSNGSASYYVEETWTGTAWENAQRYTFSYNTHGSLTEELLQEWVNSDWQNKLRLVQSFDAKENRTGYSSQEWKNAAWTTAVGWRTAYTYNNAGSPTEEANENWDEKLNDYVPIDRYLYTYNAEGALTEEAHENWDETASAFTPDNRLVYTVAGTEPWSEYTYQEWKDDAYVNQWRVINPARDAQKGLTNYESQSWDRSASAWETDSRTTITYQTNGSYQNLTEELVDGIWVNDLRWTLTYNDAGELLESKDEAWIDNKWVMTIGSRMLLSYDVAGNVKRRAYQACSINDKGYVNTNLYTYGNYQSITLASKKASVLAAATQVYPNPTSGKVTLQLADLQQGPGALQAQVLNTVGQVVQQLTLKPQQGVVQQEVDLGSLEAGIYTLRVQTSEGTVVKQIVRQ